MRLIAIALPSILAALSGSSARIHAARALTRADAGTRVATQPAPPYPPDARCGPLPDLHRPFAFGPGEQLEYAVDALGIHAGTMWLRALPPQDGLLRLRADAKTNTFFSKIRKVTGEGTSFVDPRTLHPRHYAETSVEKGQHRSAQVVFDARNRTVRIDFQRGKKSGQRRYHSARDALDVVGTIYLMRQLPLRKGLPVCMDVYGVRRLWRVFGKVVGREHISIPLGEFEAWHLSGWAVRLDDPRQRRRIHVWISDDARRLPLVAVGAIDLGVVRATLTRWIGRDGEKSQTAETPADLTW